MMFADQRILINPRFPEAEKQRMLGMLKKAPLLKKHIWMATSGSTGHSKWVALSEEAILASASSVNEHLNSDSRDIWLNPLPAFHVGGLGIKTRAHLSGAKVINYEEKWDPLVFHRLLNERNVTLSSLVPAQVYDLVSIQLKAPPSLRAIIVGGGALNATLYQKAVEWGWPLLPSYGLSECASSVATAKLQSGPAMKVLNHISLRISPEGYLCIKSPALLSLYGVVRDETIDFFDPKVDGWFTTEDKGHLHGECVEIIGRGSQFVKIGGESTDLSKLEATLEKIKLECDICFDIALLAVSDARLGHVMQLYVEEAGKEDVKPILDKFNQQVLPFEKIRAVNVVTKIPRSPLGKLLKQELSS